MEFPSWISTLSACCTTRQRHCHYCCCCGLHSLHILHRCMPLDTQTTCSGNALLLEASTHPPGEHASRVESTAATPLQMPSCCCCCCAKTSVSLFCSGRRLALRYQPREPAASRRSPQEPVRTSSLLLHPLALAARFAAPLSFLSQRHAPRSWPLRPRWLVAAVGRGWWVKAEVSLPPRPRLRRAAGGGSAWWPWRRRPGSSSWRSSSS